MIYVFYSSLTLTVVSFDFCGFSSDKSSIQRDNTENKLTGSKSYTVIIINYNWINEL